MIDLARHVSLIVKQITFVAKHAVCETRSEDSQSIAAMHQIVAELRRSAVAIEKEAKRREASAQSRAARNAILMRDRQGPGDRQ